MQEMQVRSLSWEDPLEEEMLPHSRILAWRIPWTEKCGGLQFLRLQSQTPLSVSACSWMASPCLALPDSHASHSPTPMSTLYILPSPGTALPRKSGHHAPRSLTSDPSSSHILQKSIDLIMTSSPWTDPPTFLLPYPLLPPYRSSHQLSFHDLL